MSLAVTFMSHCRMSDNNGEGPWVEHQREPDSELAEEAQQVEEARSEQQQILHNEGSHSRAAPLAVKACCI